MIALVIRLVVVVVVVLIVVVTRCRSCVVWPCGPEEAESLFTKTVPKRCDISTDVDVTGTIEAG